MKKPSLNIKTLLSITAFALVFPNVAQAEPGQLQVWNTDKAAVGIVDNFKLTLEQEFRFGDSGMSYEHSDVGVKQKLFGGLSHTLLKKHEWQ